MKIVLRPILVDEWPMGSGIWRTPYVGEAEEYAMNTKLRARLAITPGPDHWVVIAFEHVMIRLRAEGKTHAIDMVAAINREEPKDEYDRPYKAPK